MIPDKTNNIYKSKYYQVIGVLLLLVSLVSVGQAYHFTSMHYLSRKAISTDHKSVSLNDLAALCRQFHKAGSSLKDTEKMVDGIVSEAADALAVHELLYQFGIDLTQRAVINEIVKHLDQPLKKDILSMMASSNSALANLISAISFARDVLKRVMISSELQDNEKIPALKSAIQKIRQKRRFEVLARSDLENADSSAREDEIVEYVDKIKSHEDLRECRWLKLEEIVCSDLTNRDYVIEELQSGRSVSDVAHDNNIKHSSKNIGPVLENGYCLTRERAMPEYSSATRTAIVSQGFKKKQGERIIIRTEKMILCVTVDKISSVSSLSDQELTEIVKRIQAKEVEIHKLMDLREKLRNGMVHLDSMQHVVLDLTEGVTEFEFELEYVPNLMNMQPGDYQVAIYEGTPVLLRYIDCEETKGQISISSQIWFELYKSVMREIRELCPVKIGDKVIEKIVSSLIGA